MTSLLVQRLDDLRRRSLRMAALVEDVVNDACDAVLLGDETLADRAIQRDRKVDTDEVEVEKEVIRLLALHQPVGADLRLLCAIFKINNDLERIADCAVNVAERAKHLVDQPEHRENRELYELCALAQRMLRRAIQAYGSEDVESAQIIRLDDRTIDKLYIQIVRAIAKEAPAAEPGMASYLDLLSVAKNLERIADHATNIAEDVIFLRTGQIVRHR